MVRVGNHGRCSSAPGDLICESFEKGVALKEDSRLVWVQPIKVPVSMLTFVLSSALACSHSATEEYALRCPFTNVRPPEQDTWIRVSDATIVRKMWSGW